MTEQLGVSVQRICLHKNLRQMIALVLGCRLGLPVKQTEPGFTDWLFLDKGLRISRGNKGSLFIHTRIIA